jgi:hypothetical protein
MRLALNQRPPAARRANDHAKNPFCLAENIIVPTSSGRGNRGAKEKSKYVQVSTEGDRDLLLALMALSDLCPDGQFNCWSFGF